ncbi:hypothetical protein [Candidatus Aalborgicola defluviihabitans]|uniref:hypothetical protein n=1 Tax=Candidatus Aalborgicola defluviihabitans TaxID=3386187 RepID=UPI0039B976E8
MHWIALQPASDALDAPVLTDATSAWAWWALQFTPLVARLEDALLLEVSASQRLFGGVDALLAKILYQLGCSPRGIYTGRYFFNSVCAAAMPAFGRYVEPSCGV